MFALNRSQFSGWIIADRLGAIRQGKTPVAQDAQTPAAAEAAGQPAFGTRPDYRLLQSAPRILSRSGPFLGCSGGNSEGGRRLDNRRYLSGKRISVSDVSTTKMASNLAGSVVLALALT